MIHTLTRNTLYRLESYCCGQWMWVETWQEIEGLLDYLRKCDRSKFISVNGVHFTAGEYLDGVKVEFTKPNRVW